MWQLEGVSYKPEYECRMIPTRPKILKSQKATFTYEGIRGASFSTDSKGRKIPGTGTKLFLRTKLVSIKIKP